MGVLIEYISMMLLNVHCIRMQYHKHVTSDSFIS